MDIAKLFRVLVIGGAVIGAEVGCTEETKSAPAPSPDARAATVGNADASLAGDATAATGDAAATEEGMPCFCGTDDCCDVDENGVGTVRDGLYCCWQTSC